MSSVKEARSRAEAIRSHLDECWRLLAEAYEAEDWRALTYDTWAAYVEGEYGMSRRHSYRLLHHARIVEMLESSSVTHGSQRKVSDSPRQTLGPPRQIHLTERQTRHLPEDAEVIANLAQQIDAEPERERTILRDAAKAFHNGGLPAPGRKTLGGVPPAAFHRQEPDSVVPDDCDRPEVVSMDCPLCEGVGHIDSTRMAAWVADLDV